MSEQQCRHSSTADRPSRRRRGSGYTRRKSCSQSVRKNRSGKLPVTTSNTHPSLPSYPVLVCTSALSVTSSVVVTSLATVTSRLSPQVRPRRQDSQDLEFDQWEDSMWPRLDQWETRKPGLLLPGQWVTSEQGWGEKPLSLSVTTTGGILVTPLLYNHTANFSGSNIKHSVTFHEYVFN